MTDLSLEFVTHKQSFVVSLSIIIKMNVSQNVINSLLISPFVVNLILDQKIKIQFLLRLIKDI